MSREKMYALIHKMRACIVRNHFVECKGNCKECMFYVSEEEALEFFDTLIRMYRPKKAKRRWFRWHR